VRLTYGWPFCPSSAAFKVAAARGLWHPTARCITTAFTEVPDGREAVDAVVPAESLSPASDCWAGSGSSRTCTSSPPIPTAVVQEQILGIKVLDGSVSTPLFSYAFSFQIARLLLHIKNRYSDMLKHDR
jgi:hypothetical protein